MSPQDWVRVTSGFREGREGCVLRIEDWRGGGGLHVLVRFPNGSEHWQHVSTVAVVTLRQTGATTPEGK